MTSPPRRSRLARVRPHLFAYTGVVLTLYVSAVTLGAVRPCWSAGHTHAGGEDCPMHHHEQGAPGHSRHAHGEHLGQGHAAEHDIVSASPGEDSGSRMSCGCSDDPSAPYTCLVGLVRPEAPFSCEAHAHPLTGRAIESLVELRLPPPSPPPKVAFSSLS